MKFKIGDKVRVKEWVGMPDELKERWGLNMHIGDEGTIWMESYSVEDGYKGYDIKAKDSRYAFFCFEGELEPLVKVGEQLLLFEL